jgi:phosphatidylserine/phosphatidylglycerophosphate/cardiolipin synthase-like enzyme
LTANLFVEPTAGRQPILTAIASAQHTLDAKAIVTDRQLGLVGSQNLTTASLDRNREEGVLLAGPAVVSQLEATFRRDWGSAQ